MAHNSKSELADTLEFQMNAFGIHPEKEVKFHDTRKWRADFRVGTLLIEVEGGIFSGGRHVRGKGFISDCEKYAEAMLLGYRVLRIPGPWVRSGKGIEYIQRMLA